MNPTQGRCNQPTTKKLMQKKNHFAIGDDDFYLKKRKLKRYSNYNVCPFLFWVPRRILTATFLCLVG